jgi:hypothetical protein
VAAPGGYFRDLLGTPQHRTVANLVLSAEGIVDALAAVADGDEDDDERRGD